jgi:hypothetical protein
LTGIRKTVTGHGCRNRQADGVIGCFIHRADLDYCFVRYEMILVLVQLFSFYKRYRYGTSAVAPLGLVLSLIADCIMLFTGWRARNGVPRGPIATTWCSDRPRAPSPLHQDVAARTGFRQLSLSQTL